MENNEKTENMRIYPQPKDEADGDVPERDSPFVLERNGHLFQAFPLYSVSEIAREFDKDRETVATWIRKSGLAHVDGPKGAKLYIMPLIMRAWADYERR